MKKTWDQWLFLACRVALGGVFIYAGSLKIGQPGQFAADIANYRLLPEGLTLWAAYLLPWLEVVCGLALILGFLKKGASIWITLMMTAFLTALAVNMVRGVNVDCGCFGGSGSDVSQAFYRDLALVPLCLAALYSSFSRRLNSR